MEIRGRRLSRRQLLREGAAAVLLGRAPAFAAERDPGRRPVDANPSGIVYVIVFSNFEGSPLDAGSAIAWFEACTQAHPQIVWSHMYNPRLLVLHSPEFVQAESQLTPYLHRVRDQRGAEVGLHIHLHYDLVRQAGVEPRAFPYAGDKSEGCQHPRRIEEDPGLGYDVLLTGYSPEERAAILDMSSGAFLAKGFGRPTSFCAGYSAADPALQALLARRGFVASFAAQVTPPEHYGTCWDRLLEWSGRITPLTMPYRVARETILPPPHLPGEHLDLVEVPLNLGVDAYDLYFENKPVPRTDMFDRHFDWAVRTGKETAVAIGVHAEVVAQETWERGPVFQVVHRFLSHVERRAAEGGARVAYATVSDVARRFRGNETVGQVLPIPP